MNSQYQDVEYVIIANTSKGHHETVMFFDDLHEAQSYKNVLDSAVYTIVRRTTTINDEEIA
jgi:hypothetical protein